MKKTFPVFTLLLLSFTIITAPLRAQDCAQSWIDSIRAELAAIKAPVVKYRVKDDDSNYVSSKGAEIKKYYEGKHLRKATLDALERWETAR